MLLPRCGKVIGSVGPTTSYRMDAFTPKLIENGLPGMIGKGNRSPEIVAAIKKYGAVYFGAIGGIAALTAQCIKKVELIAYEDIGPEAIRSYCKHAGILVDDIGSNGRKRQRKT
jgi:fumarate hydratase subunit beta